jgi:DNA-directed RNA polymerase specialized sigma24 family protein
MTREKYGEAYQRGYDFTVKFLISRGVRPQSAVETAQAAWVKGWIHLGQLRHEAMLMTWVNKIALNVYRGGMREQPLQSLSRPEMFPGKGVNLAAIELGQVLAACPPRTRALLEMRKQGMTAKEIALRLGITELAAKLRLFRAQQVAAGRCDPKNKRKIVHDLLRKLSV